MQALHNEARPGAAWHGLTRAPGCPLWPVGRHGGHSLGGGARGVDERGAPPLALPPPPGREPPAAVQCSHMHARMHVCVERQGSRMSAQSEHPSTHPCMHACTHAEHVCGVLHQKRSAIHHPPLPAPPPTPRTDGYCHTHARTPAGGAALVLCIMAAHIWWSWGLRPAPR